MSLFDIVAQKYEAPARGSKSPKRSESPLKELKELRAPLGKRPKSTQLANSVSDDELRDFLGDEWGEIKDDLDIRETCRSRITEARLIERGIVPSDYTSVTNCAYCGPVFIYEGYPNPANNCPWCFNRIKGLPIPRGVAK